MKKKTEERPCVSDADKNMLLRLLIRSSDLFESFKHHLEPDHFGDLNLVGAAVWRSVLNFHKEHEQLPTKALLKAGLLTAISGGGDVKVRTTEATAFIEELFEEPLEDNGSGMLATYGEWVARIIRWIREEHAQAKLLKALGGRGLLAVDPPHCFEAARQEACQIAAINRPSLEIMFPHGWDQEAGLGVFSTNLPFVDDFLGGGHAPGEVYGLLGPYGSGKTMLAMMLAVEGARQAHNALQAGSDFHEYVFLVSYEARIPELQMRAMSYAAQVSRESLNEMGPAGLKSLSTTGTLRPYEKRMFSAALSAGKTVLGEQERVREAETLLNKHLIAFDMSGYDKQRPGAGAGYVKEISERIAAVLRLKGKNAKARLVVVDYVGAMAKRHLAATNEDLNTLRHKISDAPLTARNLIANEFGCPVWLLHQLSGESNKKSPGASYHHTDAAEARNFAENLDFAFVLGAQDDRGLCQITCSKHRRTGGRDAAIIQMRGEMNAIVGTSNRYMIDPSTRRIMERDSSHMPAVSKTVQTFKTWLKAHGTSDSDGFGSISHIL